MSAISWKYNTDGVWSNAANWSGGVLPGAADDVTLATLSYHTITHGSGNDQIHNLQATTDSLAVTGGTLSIAGTASFGRNLVLSAGTLALLGTAASVTGTFNGTGGNLLLGSGTALTLNGPSNFGTTNVSYGTEIDGPGTLATLGTTTIAAAYYDGMVLGNGVTWNNQGTVNDAGGVYLGDGTGLGATLTNAAGVAFNLTTDSANIVNGYDYNAQGQQVYGTSSFSNAGTLDKTGGTGTSRIYSVVTNTGVIAAATGTLEFDGGGSFGGTLSGAGTIAFGGGTATITAGTGLAAANLLFDGAVASLTKPLATTGSLTLSNGSLTLDGSADSVAAFTQIGYYSDHLDLNGSTLSVGNAYLGSGYTEGPGTLALSGTTTLSGWNNYTYYLGGGVTLSNAGTLNQAYYVYVDYPSGAGFTIVNKAGATYNVTGDFSLGGNNYNGIGSTVTNAGTFAKTGGTGTTQIISAFNSTGTVNAATGTIEFDGGGTIGGSLTGTGTVAFASGSETLAAGVLLAAPEILFDGGTITLGGNETYTAQQLVETNGRVLLNHHTLAETSAYLGGGAITGPGTLTTAGTTTLSGNNGGGVLYLGGGVSLVNSGVINQLYYLYVDSATGAGFSVTNKVGATYNIAGNFNIGGNNYNGIGSTFANAGTFAKVAGTGTTQVISAFTSTGTITSAVGNLEFDGGGTFGGKLTGAGTISFSSNVTLSAGVALQVSTLNIYNSITVTLAGNVSDTNAFDISSGYIFLGGNTLTLAAPNLSNATIDGPGTLALSGTTTLGQNGYFSFGGNTTISNTGTVDQNGTVYVSYQSGSGFTVNNKAGATWDLTNTYYLGGNNYNGTSSTFNNAGTFTLTGGTSYSLIYSIFNSTGTISATVGEIAFESGGTFSGTLGGNGLISFQNSSYSLGSLTETSTAAAEFYQSTINLSAGLTFNGTLRVNGSPSTVNLGGQTFALGTLALANAGAALYFEQAGTLSTTGTGSIVDWYSNGIMISFGGGSSWVNSGTLLDGGVVQLGDNHIINGTSAGTLVNKAGAVFDLTSDDAAFHQGNYTNSYGTAVASGAVILNAGTLAKTAGTGTSHIYGTLTSTGTLATSNGTSSTSGTLELDNGGSVSGLIAGGSNILFAGGAFADGALTVGGGAVVSSSVTLDATGALTLGDTTGAAATFTNSRLFRLDADIGIASGSGAASAFVNASGGTLSKIGGTGRSVISAGVANAGTILAGSGTLALTGAVTGTGVLDIGAGATLELGGSVASTQGVTYTAATGTLLLDSIAGATQTISGLTVGDVIDLANTTATKAVVNAADQLVISNGTTVVAQLQLAGSYLSDTFTVGSDGHGGSLVTLTKATTAWQGGSADWFGTNVWTNGVPNAQTDATIAQTGTYTVTLNGGETAYASTLLLNAPAATFNLYGTLNITNTFTETAGALAVSGGTIKGGTLAVASGAACTFGNGATLANVVYQGTMDLSENYANVTWIGTTSITGSAGHGAGTINLTGYDSTLYVDDYQTLTNAAVNIGNNSYYATLRSYDTTGQGAILTLDTSLTITHTGIYATLSDGGNGYDALYNEGKITAGLSGGTFTVTGNDFENDATIAVSNGDALILQSGTFANTGTMTVSAARLDLYGVIQNTGSITATNSTLNIHSAITGTLLTGIASGGDTLNLSGVLDEAGGTLSVGGGAKIVALNLSGEILNATVKPAAGAFTFLNGSTLDNVTYMGTMAVGSGVAVTLDDTLAGATIADSGGGILFGSNVILNGDTYQGTLSLLSGNSASITGGLTLKGVGGTGTGAINATAGAAESVLYFLDNETLSNVAITSGGGSGGTLGLFLDPIVPGAGTLTLAASTSFHVLTDTTAGLFSVSPTTGQASNDMVVNNGQITLDAGATFLGSDGSLGGFTNGGTIALGAGAVWTAPAGTLTSSAFTNTAAGKITLSSNATLATNGGGMVNAGSITVGTSALVDVQGNFSQTGSVSVASGASFDIFGTTTLASVAAISGAGTLGIDGLLNLGGGTFDMAASGRISNVMIGGDLKGGTFLNDAGTVTFGTLATLDGITWKGALNIGTGSTVQVLNGLTLLTSSGGTPGVVGLTGGGALDYVAGASLDNITLTSSSPSAGVTSPGLADALEIGTANGTLTLGAHALISANAGALTFADTAGGGTLVNNGQINVTGGALWLDSSFASVTNNSTITLASDTEFDPTPSSTGPTNFTNAGLVTLTSLDDFDLSGNGTNAGTVTIGAGSEASFGGNFANTGVITMSHGGTLSAGGTLTSTGTIIASGAASDFVSATAGAGSAFNAGTLTGGVWDVSAASTLTLDFGGALTSIAADVVISGANSVLRSVGTTIARVESTLATIASGGTLALLSGRSYSTGQALTDAGTLQLQNGTLTTGGLTVATGALLTGSGTVAGTVGNAGTIDAKGGTLTLSGATTGAGSLKIEAGSELVLGAANAETVLFNSATSELRLNTPTSFTGTLSGFGAGDSLLLMSTTGTAASISGTSLTVTLSGGGTEIFKLATSQAAKTLTVTSDGQGDTLITYPTGQAHGAPRPADTSAMRFIAAMPVVAGAPALADMTPGLHETSDWTGGLAAATPAAPLPAATLRPEAADSWAERLHAVHETHGHMMLSGRV